MTLALVRDMRELREPSGAKEIEAFETDVLTGFVLAGASAGQADALTRASLPGLDESNAAGPHHVDQKVILSSTAEASAGMTCPPKHDLLSP